MPRRSRNSTASGPISQSCAPTPRSPRARAIAILEHDIVLLLGPGNKKIKSLAELKKKKVAVLAEGDNKPGYEFVRDEIGMRRDYFKRRAGDCEATDNNVVAVKPAQGA